MADIRKHSSTSNLIRFTLKHATTGVGLTGLSSASTGLIISTIADNEASATTYTVAGSTIESITTLGTFAAPTATKCRFKEVDATNHKGLYEFQFADARFSVASAKRLVISCTGATNLLDADYEIQLVQYDPYDAVRMGMTALPNAAAEAAGGLYTRGTGAGQIAQDANGNIRANLDTIKTQTVTCSGGVTIPAATLASTTNITAATGITVATNGDKTGYSLTQTFPANFADLSISVTTGLVDITQAAADKAWGTATRVLTANTNLNDPSAATIAGAVWDEAIAGHLGAGSTGAALNAAGSAGDPWSTAIPGAYGAGTAGKIIGDALTGHIPQTGDSYAVVTNGTYGNSAIRTRGDAAWTTAVGFSTHSAADVWAVATRVLTAGTNISLAKGVGVTGFNDIAATDVWAAATRSLTDKAGFSLAAGQQVDATKINGSAAAAAQLALSAATIVNGTAIAGTLSTTQMTTNLTEATTDHYKGRIIIWTSGTLINQATDITAYDGATKMLTYTATTEAPLANDTFIII